MSQEMYGAKGKLANKVYYKGSNGKTIVRELVTPKNPKTNAQTLQRVLVAQVGLTYKAFKELCDHSFEGYTMGAQCANRFRKVNLQYLRDRASEINQAGISLASFYNFQKIGSTKFVPGAAIIAQGSLPQIFCGLGTTSDSVEVATVEVATNTYQGVCDALRLKRGDQLTFVTVNKVNGEYIVSKARIILDPRNIDGSGAAMSTTFVDASGNILMPNWKNAGTLFMRHEDGMLKFIAEPYASSVPVAAAIIASRKATDGSWLRSNAQLVLSEERIGSDLCSLYEAIYGSYSASDVDLENEAYLNNAGEGGAQSGNTGGITPSTNPTYNSNVSINGVSQSVAGGSVMVDAPLNTIVIGGNNLSEAPVYATKNNGAQIEPVKTATSITFSGLNAGAGDVVRVYKNGSLFFSVTAVEQTPGGGSEGGGVNVPITITHVNGTSHAVGDTVNIAPNDSITISGSGFGTDSSKWRIVKGSTENEPGPLSDNEVTFAGLSSTGTWTVTYDGQSVLTINVTSTGGQD